MKHRLFSLLLTLSIYFLACTSCAISLGDNINKETTNLHLTVIERISEHKALAATDKNDIILLFSTDILYAGKKIYGHYTLIGKYLHEGVIIPIFVRTSEYKELKANRKNWLEQDGDSFSKMQLCIR